MSLFDDFDWSSVVKPLVQAVPGAIATTLGSAGVARANTNAANIATNAGNQNIALLQQGQQQAQAAQAPAIAHFKTVMGADPSVLTPAQQISVADADRKFNGSNLIGTVGGRAYSRMYNDQDARARAAAVQSNVARGDAAAGQVGSLGGNQGNIALNTARAISGENSGIATNQGNALTGTANADAQAYGQIGSYFAGATKDNDRNSRYADYKTARV